MVLSMLTTWCCQLFERICQSLSEGYFIPFSKTACFFYKTLCEETLTDNITSKTIGPYCNFNYYFDYIFKKVSSPWCNITTVNILSKDKFTKHDNLSTDIVFQAAPENSCPKEDWCNITNYLNYWWNKLYDHWCTIAGCTKKKNMESDLIDLIQYNPVIDLIQSNPITESIQSNPIVEVIAAKNAEGLLSWFQNIKVNYINSNNAKFLAVGSVIGGILTSIYLVYTRKPSNSKSKCIDNAKKLLKSEDYNADKLIEILEAVDQENVELKNKINENATKSLETIQQFQTEINKLSDECNQTQNQLVQQSEMVEELQEYVVSLKFRCDDYEDEVQRLQEQIREKIDSYDKDIRQLNEELVQIKGGTVDRKKNYLNSHTSSSENPFVENALTKIEQIMMDTVVLESEVEMFIGKKTDKDFLHLKERLIRNTVDLDNVESDGHLIIRNKRKEALEFVYNCLKVLKSKAE